MTQEELAKLQAEASGCIIPAKDYLTVRDQFAMAALTGLLSGERDLYHLDDVKVVTSIAAECYVMADAMLEARKK